MNKRSGGVDSNILEPKALVHSLGKFITVATPLAKVTKSRSSNIEAIAIKRKTVKAFGSATRRSHKHDSNHSKRQNMIMNEVYHLTSSEDQWIIDILFYVCTFLHATGSISVQSGCLPG